MALDEQTTGRILGMERVKQGLKEAISGVYLDLGGERIGTEENLVRAFRDVIFYIGQDAGGRGGEESVFLSDSINEYKAIRFCCGMDTNVYDKNINEALDEWEPLSDKSVRV